MDYEAKMRQEAFKEASERVETLKKRFVLWLVLYPAVKMYLEFIETQVCPMEGGKLSKHWVTKADASNTVKLCLKFGLAQTEDALVSDVKIYADALRVKQMAYNYTLMSQDIPEEAVKAFQELLEDLNGPEE